jgi:hypothetical protein
MSSDNITNNFSISFGGNHTGTPSAGNSHSLQEWRVTQGDSRAPSRRSQGTLHVSRNAPTGFFQTTKLGQNHLFQSPDEALTPYDITGGRPDDTALVGARFGERILDQLEVLKRKFLDRLDQTAENKQIREIEDCFDQVTRQVEGFVDRCKSHIDRRPQLHEDSSRISTQLQRIMKDLSPKLSKEDLQKASTDLDKLELEISSLELPKIKKDVCLFRNALIKQRELPDDGWRSLYPLNHSMEMYFDFCWALHSTSLLLNQVDDFSCFKDAVISHQSTRTIPALFLICAKETFSDMKQAWVKSYSSHSATTSSTATST